MARISLEEWRFTTSPEFTSVPSNPWLSSDLLSPEDGVECRDLHHFTRWEGVYGANMTLAGSKKRKSIRWEQ